MFKLLPFAALFLISYRDVFEIRKFFEHLYAFIFVYYRMQEKQRKECEKVQKEALKRIPPWEMFKQGKDAEKFLKYDDKGIPTHLANGEEISKKQRKKLERLYEARQKNYEQVHFFSRFMIPSYLSVFLRCF